MVIECRGWVEPASFKHIAYLLEEGLRDADVAELAAQERNPEEALVGSWEASKPHAFVVKSDGRPAAMFGVAQIPDMPFWGSPWLLGTDLILTIRRDFVAQSRAWVDYMNEVFPILANWVDGRNTVSRRWLEHCGFKFNGVTEPMGGTIFHYFQRTGT